MGIQVLHGLSRGLRTRAHDYQYALGIMGTNILKQVILPAGKFSELVHHLLHGIRHGRIVGVD